MQTTDLTFTVNGETYTPPTVPVLLQILSGAEDVSSLLPSESIYYLPKDSSVEVSIPAGVAGGPVSLKSPSFGESIKLMLNLASHPPTRRMVQFPKCYKADLWCSIFRQHNFDVVRAAGSDTYNYDNPVRRDVVSLGVAGDNVTIRWTTDNPGPWILHWYVAGSGWPTLYWSIDCSHIDWHLEL